MYGKECKPVPGAWEQIKLIGGMVSDALVAAKDEQFEDGMDSQFAATIMDIIKEHGDIAVDLIFQMVACGNVGGDISQEMLVTFGRIDDPPTYESRRRILKQSLMCVASRDEWERIQIVDGALAAIGVMDDVEFVSCLEHAVKHEKHDELRADIQQVLDSLKG